MCKQQVERGKNEARALPLINEVNQNYIEDQIKAKSSVRQYVEAEDDEYDEDFIEPKEEDITPIKSIEEHSYNFEI